MGETCSRGQKSACRLDGSVVQSLQTGGSESNDSTDPSKSRARSPEQNERASASSRGALARALAEISTRKLAALEGPKLGIGGF